MAYMRYLHADPGYTAAVEARVEVLAGKHRRFYRGINLDAARWVQTRDYRPPAKWPWL